MKKFLFLLVTMFTFLGHQANAQQITVIIGSAMGNVGDVVNVPVYVIVPSANQFIEGAQGAIISTDPSVAQIVGAQGALPIIQTLVVNSGACNFQAGNINGFTPPNGLLLTLQVEIVGTGCSDFVLAPTVGVPSSQTVEFTVDGVAYDNLETDFIVNTGSVCLNCIDFQPGAPTDLNCKSGIGPVGGPSSTHTLSWSAVPGAVSYEVQFVYNDPACCPGIIGTPTTAIVAHGGTSMIVQTGSCYSWRVRAVFSNGATSGWSSRSCTCAFYSSDGSSGGKSLTPSDDSFEAGEVRLAAVPNPATNNVEITLSALSADMMLAQPEVIIYDMTGKVILRSPLTVDEAKRVDLSDFEPGTYIIKAVDGDTLLSTEKLVVQ